MSRCLYWIALLLVSPLLFAGADGFAGLDAHGQNGTTGGAGGPTIEVSSLDGLVRAAARPGPAVVLIKGKILAEAGTLVDVGPNKTIVGKAGDAELVGIELHLKNVANVIIRNLTIRDSFVASDPSGKTQDFDCIQADAVHHLWIDHCHFARAGDGLIDLRKGCDCVTISWCILEDQNKALGIGWSDKTNFRITIHHTWIRNTNQRNPAFDNGMGHLYNNYFESITACGVDARGKARLVVENCVFAAVRNPLRREPDAQLVSRGNILRNCLGDREPGGTAFDPKEFYHDKIDAAEVVAERLRQHAGPQKEPGLE